VRVTTRLNKLLNLTGIAVRGMCLPAAAGKPLVVDIALRSPRHACPLWGYTTPARYESPAEPSWRRHPDFGTAPVVVRAMLRRLVCPVYEVVVEAVLFAQHRAGAGPASSPVLLACRQERRQTRCRPSG
jgi:hypothetical protein